MLSTQEELGERGVKVAVGKVAPQIALCFEGCPADDTFTEPYAIQTALKKVQCFALWTNQLYAPQDISATY